MLAECKDIKLAKIEAVLGLKERETNSARLTPEECFPPFCVAAGQATPKLRRLEGQCIRSDVLQWERGWAGKPGFFRSTWPLLGLGWPRCVWKRSRGFCGNAWRSWGLLGHGTLSRRGFLGLSHSMGSSRSLDFFISAGFEEAGAVRTFIRAGFGSRRAAYPLCFIGQTNSQGHPRFGGGKQTPPLEWVSST